MTNTASTCCCGARYSAFRATDEAGNVLTYAAVREMMRIGSDDASLWVCRSRGAVLRFWSFLKRAQFEQAHGYCEAALEAAAVTTDATAEELPAWVTDTTVVEAECTELDATVDAVVELEVEATVAAAPIAVVVVSYPAAASRKHSPQNLPAWSATTIQRCPATGCRASPSSPPVVASGVRCPTRPLGRRTTMYRRPPMIIATLRGADA